LNDVLLSVNGRAMDNVAAWTGASFQHVPGTPMTVQVLRGDRTLSFSITPIDQEQPSERLADLTDLTKSRLSSLGVMAVDFDEHVASLLGAVRLSSGAVIVATTTAGSGGTGDLKPGDIIHEINGKSVGSVENLRAVLQDLSSGDPVALLIERAGQLLYVAFNLS